MIKVFWQITYYDKRYGIRFSYMNIAFETEQLAKDELKRILRDRKEKSYKLYRTYFKVKSIKIKLINN